MKRNPLWDAHAKQYIASGAPQAGAPMSAEVPNALSRQAVPGAGLGANLARGGAALGAFMGGRGGKPVQSFNSQRDALMAARQQQQQMRGPASEDDIRQAYANGMGREPDAEGMQAHLANPGGKAAALDAIYNSPEAQAYNRQQYEQKMAAAQQQQQMAPPPGPPQGPPQAMPPPQNPDLQPQPMPPGMADAGAAMQKQQVDPRMQRMDPRMRDPRMREEMLRRQQMANQGTPFQYRVSRGIR